MGDEITIGIIVVVIVNVVIVIVAIVAIIKLSIYLMLLLQQQHHKGTLLHINLSNPVTNNLLLTHLLHLSRKLNDPTIIINSCIIQSPNQPSKQQTEHIHYMSLNVGFEQFVVG